jgi:Ni/Co efflux regulator RcnB
MKKLMTGAMTAVLLASVAAPALAQDGRWRDGDPRNSGGAARQGAWINRAPEQQAQPQAQAPAEPARDADRDRSDRGDRNRGDDGQRNRADDGQRNGNDRRGADDRGGRDWNRDRGDQNRDRGDRNWNRGDRDRNWSGRDWNRERPRYDRRYYAPTWRSQQRYRGGLYRPPSGFYSRSWVFGDILPRGWYGPQYYIGDWYDYGLPIPPVGYEWTRIGDDAVLVDTFSGRIVQVVPDLFW